MATIASRITSNGTLLVNGSFDEFTGAPITDSSVVLWLDAAQSTSYPGTGTTWTSIAPTTSTATLISGPAFSSSSGGYISFDGVDDYVSFSAPNLTTAVTVATIEMWVKINATGNRMPFGFQTYDVYLSGGNMGYNTGASDLYGIPAATVTSLGIVGNWRHLVFVMQNNTSATVNPYTNNKIYVNGVVQSLSQITSSQSGTTRTFNNGVGVISGWNDNLAQYKALMDLAVFKIYNRELTAEEIQQNYNALDSRFGLTPIANVNSRIRTNIDNILATEFDEVTFNPLSTLLNTGRYNLVSYSNYFAIVSTTGWNNIFPTAATVTTGIDAPDNSLTAVRLSCNNTTNALLRNIFTAFTPNGIDTYTMSFWARHISGSKTGLSSDLNDGVGLNYGPLLVTGQWVNISYSGVLAPGARTFMDIIGDSTNNNVIDFWGVQIERNTTVSIHQTIVNNIVTPTFAKRETNIGKLYVTESFDEFTGAPVVDSSLVLWVDAGQTSSYSGSGSTVVNLRNPSINGTLTNNPVYNVSGSFSFNGTNQFITFGDNLDLIGSDISGSIWVNLNSYDATFSPLIDKLETAGNYRFFVNASGTVGFGIRGAGNVYEAISTPSAILTGAWYNLAFTFQGTVISIYINGTLVTSGTLATITRADTTSHLKIGYSDNNARFLNGLVSQAQLYNRALTAVEVRQNFNALRRRYGI